MVLRPSIGSSMLAQHDNSWQWRRHIPLASIGMMVAGPRAVSGFTLPAVMFGADYDISIARAAARPGIAARGDPGTGGFGRPRRRWQRKRRTGVVVVGASMDMDGDDEDGEFDVSSIPFAYLFSVCHWLRQHDRQAYEAERFSSWHRWCVLVCLYCFLSV